MRLTRNHLPALIAAAGLMLPTVAMAHEENQRLLSGSIGGAKQTVTQGSQEASGEQLSIGLRFALPLYADDRLVAAIETGWEDFGQFDDTYDTALLGDVNGEFETSAITVGAKFGARLASNATLYVRGGMSGWSTDYTLTQQSTGATSSGDDEGFDPYYGIGFEFAADDLVSVGIEYTRHDLSQDNLDYDIEVDRVALFGGFKF